MDKISELKEKLADKYDNWNHEGGHGGGYKEGFLLGFNAAMELQLPVLFGQYITRVCIIITINQYKIIGEPTYYTTEQLYDYWISNIYQPK